MNPQLTVTALARRTAAQLAAMLVLVGLGISFAAAPVASADGGREIRIYDRCDPASFNEAVGPGTCVGDGDITFGEMISQVNPVDFGHDKWNFSRRDLTIKAGETVHIANRGGETHSFTEVFNFGPGIVPPLNAVFPEGTPAAVPVAASEGEVFATFYGPGGQADIAGLGKGSHKFMCLIHPWMQTIVTVK